MTAPRQNPKLQAYQSGVAQLISEYQARFDQIMGYEYKVRDLGEYQRPLTAAEKADRKRQADIIKAQEKVRKAQQELDALTAGEDDEDNPHNPPF